MSTIFLFNCFFWTTGVSNLLLGLGGPYIGFLAGFLTDSTTGDLETDGIALPALLLSLLATPAPKVFTRGGDVDLSASTSITLFTSDSASSVEPLSSAEDSVEEPFCSLTDFSLSPDPATPSSSSSLLVSPLLSDFDV